MAINGLNRKEWTVIVQGDWYEDDLKRFDGIFDVKSVANRETIAVVVGTSLVAELLDRQVAQALRTLIDEKGKPLPYRRAVVVTDRGWSDLNWFWAENPVIAIGGPAINALSAEFLRTSEEISPQGTYKLDHSGLTGFYRKSNRGHPQIGLWGNTATGTRRAVEIYAAKPEGLEVFLSMCWPKRD
jgi:hypothetical protein